ncbi:MAG: hypothetical protein PHG66_03110 [Candidatus Colwellbacteria bacterium]|nr:hypothetical protein [Candidatus Colwellbacteria bacterium]
MDITEAYKKIHDITAAIPINGEEILGVYIGIKPAMAEANTGIYNADFLRKMSVVNSICGELGLKLAVSKYKYVINSPRGIFKEVLRDDPAPGCLIIGIARDMEKAVSGVAHYHLKMHHSKYGRSFAELMGYPSCCIDFGDYLANNKGDPDNFGFKNPAIEVLKRSDKVAWQLNVFSTSSMLSHFPCSYTCKKSIDYMNSLLGAIKEADLEHGRVVEDNLKQDISVYWSCVDKVMLRGDFIKKDSLFREGEARYESIKWPIGSENFYQEVDSEYLDGMKTIWRSMGEGDCIKISKNSVSVFKGDDEIGLFEKDSQYSPVIVRADA